MPKQYRVTAPDGHVITLSGPEGATDDEVLAQAQQLYKPQQAAPSPSLLASRQAASASEFDKNNPGSTMATRANAVGQGINDATGGILGDTLSGNASGLVDKAKNILGGLYGFGKGAVTHPVDTAVNAVKGVGESLIAGPQQALQGLSEGDYDKMAEGVGGTVATDFPAAYGAAKGVESLAQKARRVLAGGDVSYMEQQIAPSGKEAAKTAAQRAPELAQDPLYLKAKGAQFDKLTYSKFKNAEHALSAAEQSVPAGTVLPKAPITNGIIDAMDELQSFRGNPDVIASPGAEKLLGEWYNKLDKLPDQLPFEEVRDFRQKLDKEIMVHGGWRETATAAERTEMEALRKVVNLIRERTKGISSTLDAADTAYSQAADTMAASGIDPDLGRRLVGPSGVGKPSDLQKKAKIALSEAGKGAAKGAGFSAAGYGLYRLLKD